MILRNIFTISILGVGLLGIASLIPFGIKSLEQSNNRSVAMHLVNQGIERVKTIPFEEVVNSNLPYEDYGTIPDASEFARAYAVSDAYDANSNLLPQLKMVTVQVFWFTNNFVEDRVYGVTYLCPSFN